ncbi:hypothetical protein AGMMS49944_03890 [Spirochaetia bacterium]|nr:hypothetical protein AGMMS49944_03890 [Spirochaetia bacterium]
MTVKLKGGTVGEPLGSLNGVDVGSVVTVILDDENGNLIEKSGKIAEILEW